jgi:hypothetical protein
LPTLIASVDRQRRAPTLIANIDYHHWPPASATRIDYPHRLPASITRIDYPHRLPWAETSRGVNHTLEQTDRAFSFRTLRMKPFYVLTRQGRCEARARTHGPPREITVKVAFWFVVGTIGGYLLILFGWVAYTNMVHVSDGDGGKIMAVAFTLAPLGGLLLGATLAVLFGRRRAPPAQVNAGPAPPP